MRHKDKSIVAIFIVTFISVAYSSEVGTRVGSLLRGIQQSNNNSANSSAAEESPPVDPKDSKLSAPEIIIKYGFPVEIHKVNSSNYILTHHRLPRPGAFPVFLSHGILCSSRDWLMQRGQNGLAYQLYNAGYDVWLGNTRGNNYSMEHTTLNPDQLAFWDFAVDEISLEDVPTNIDYVLRTTNRTKLGWIGYSLGTTTLFAGLIKQPEYQNKLEFFVGLAPVTVTGHCGSQISRLLSGLSLPEEPLKSFLNLLGNGKFMPSMVLDVINKFLPTLCAIEPSRPEFCGNSLALVGGFNPKQIDNDMQPIIFGGFPSPVSVKMLVQQLQGVITGAGKFRQYHFQTPCENNRTYGRINPPQYNLTEFQVPTFLFAGQNDFLAAPKDVALLVTKLPPSSLKYFHNVSDTSWTHLDFIYGKEAKSLVYDIIIAKLNEFLSNPN